jgi:hypothetical protein
MRSKNGERITFSHREKKIKEIEETATQNVMRMVKKQVKKN